MLSPEFFLISAVIGGLWLGILCLMLWPVYSSGRPSRRRPATGSPGGPGETWPVDFAIGLFGLNVIVVLSTGMLLSFGTMMLIFVGPAAAFVYLLYTGVQGGWPGLAGLAVFLVVLVGGSLALVRVGRLRPFRIMAAGGLALIAGYGTADLLVDAQLKARMDRQGLSSACFARQSLRSMIVNSQFDFVYVGHAVVLDRGQWWHWSFRNQRWERYAPQYLEPDLLACASGSTPGTPGGPRNGAYSSKPGTD
jgi:hypothetical protein